MPAEAESSGGVPPEEVSFLRTGDHISLSTGHTGERIALAAEAFGNRICFLEQLNLKDFPPDISLCTFTLDQALSVRALEEMIMSPHKAAGAVGGSKTLLYGHAVQLKHLYTSMYLACLPTNSSKDKLAFDVGLQESSEGEATWWTIHPASKQRSEGEKVRCGDDLILVSVATERYLHIGSGHKVIASFQQTLWTVQPISTGSVRQKALGFVFGYDVVRLFHGHMDECLVIPPVSQETCTQVVMYETGSVCRSARSLWRIEHIKTKWSGSFIGWGNPVRLRHITSGRYLAVVGEQNSLATVHRRDASDVACTFIIRQTKDDKRQGEMLEIEGMGTPDLKYGDSIINIQHLDTGLWLSYRTFETKKKGVGRVEEKQACMLIEGHMDDGLSLSRALDEEAKSARVIRKCTWIFHKFIAALSHLKKGPADDVWTRVTLSEVQRCLADLIELFSPPLDTDTHEEKQLKLKILRNRQDLLQEEGMVPLIIETIDTLSYFKTGAQFAVYMGSEDAAEVWDDISNSLYLLLASVIRGNRTNCNEFAQAERLDWLVDRLKNQTGSSSGVLDVFHCILTGSPEALNVIREQHIETIIGLIDQSGRAPKILEVLCSLCVGNGIAVRSNQNLICNNLLPGRDLLLQTDLIDYVNAVYPNVFIGVAEASGTFRKWYFEAIIDQITQVSHLEPHIRIGWANTVGFMPYPGSGARWGANGVGDDLSSWGFDGSRIWTQGRDTLVRSSPEQRLQKGDIIGCYLDLNIPKIYFTVNGIKIRGYFTNFNTDGLFFPCISMSAEVSCRFLFGGEHGRLKHGPAEDFSPVCEQMLPGEELTVRTIFSFGTLPKNIYQGPDDIPFRPRLISPPIDTSTTVFPVYLDQIRDRLVENIHDIWAAGKIEQGWMWGERLDDQYRTNPFLTAFEQLPDGERQLKQRQGTDIVKAVLALGYHFTADTQKQQNLRLKYAKLPTTFLQANGYKPSPLDTTSIPVADVLSPLVERMAENLHNVWARDRIKLGWTYGLNEDAVTRRTPYLVPYNLLSQDVRQANYDTASEHIRTVLAYGWLIEKPTADLSADQQGQGLDADQKGITKVKRTYCAQSTYAVHEGKWYYEVELITAGPMRIGWAKESMAPDSLLGADANSYAFDGSTAMRCNGSSQPYGKQWQPGDILGCMLNIEDKTIIFSLNGELLMDARGQEIAFQEIDVNNCAYVPAFTLGLNQKIRLNFGHDVNTLKYITSFGLQEGYEPFCVNMSRRLPLWYGQQRTQFKDVAEDDAKLEISRVQAGSGAPPCLKVESKLFGVVPKVGLNYLRLSLPVVCKSEFSNWPDYLVAGMPFAQQRPRENAPEVRSPRGRLVKKGVAGKDGAKAGKSGAAGAAAQKRQAYSTGAASRNASSGDQLQKEEQMVRMVDTLSAFGMMSPAGPARPVAPDASPRTQRAMQQQQQQQLALAGGKVPPTDKKDRQQWPNSNEADVDASSKKHQQLDTKSLHSVAISFKDDSTSQHAQQQQQQQLIWPFHSSLKHAAGGGFHSPTAKSPVPSSPRSTHQSTPETIRKFAAEATREIVLAGQQFLAEQQQQQLMHYKSKTRSALDKLRSKRLTSIFKGRGHSRESSPIRLTGVEEALLSGHMGAPNTEADLLAMADSVPPEFRATLGEAALAAAEYGLTPADLEQSRVNEIDEYYYAVRVLPGQEPGRVFVGWVSPDYKPPGSTLTASTAPTTAGSPDFDVKAVRSCTIQALDVDYKPKQMAVRQDCYVVSVGVLYHRSESMRRQAVVAQAPSSRSQPGIHIGCSINVGTGKLTFFVNGEEAPNKFYVEPGTRLFPAVFFEPTCKEALQFELSRTKNALPLSAALFRTGKHAIPQCPPRLGLQSLQTYRWARVPNKQLRVNILKLSAIRGWSLLCDEPVQMLAIYIPEEDRCLDILELVYDQALLEFHTKTLELYQALCSHGNHVAAHCITQHVNIRQLIYCTKEESLFGSLRSGFFDLLHSIHLNAHIASRAVTRQIFIAPLDANSLGEPPADEELVSIGLGSTMTILPPLPLTSGTTPSGELTSPTFPLEELKQYVMADLTAAVQLAGQKVRDPIGDSYANMIVPLLRVCNSLLIIGLLNEQDLMQLLAILDPKSFPYESFEFRCIKGLVDMSIDEPIKLELCRIMATLCDIQLRRRVEALLKFSNVLVEELKNDQQRRYTEIQEANLPPVVAAKKTKEFRCLPLEQMRALLAFKDATALAGSEENPCRPDMQGFLHWFHYKLKTACALPDSDASAQAAADAQSAQELADAQSPNFFRRVLQAIQSITEIAEGEDGGDSGSQLDLANNGAMAAFQPMFVDKALQRTVVTNVKIWSTESHIQNQKLVTEMFSLIHRQFDEIGEIIRSLSTSYMVSRASERDIIKLLDNVVKIKCLLDVQVSLEEEEVLRESLRSMMQNKVFFQHPDLMRMLNVHEIVLQLTVNTLNKAQQQEKSATTAVATGTVDGGAAGPNTAADMVVMCSRFLCYFCRTSRENQRAMFNHLTFLLENSTMLLSRPSLRGSCPIDVAYSSLMDNNELALSLREAQLEKVVQYLGRCGVQSNSELIGKGYPDIGWDPVEGERFLDFLRFCVWVNEESVEENANLIVKLLIRRPESLGPALRPEGGGLLKAIRDGMRMSMQIAFSKGNTGFLTALGDDGGEPDFIKQSKFDFSTLPPDSDEDYIDMGSAILSFYASLVDLLGRCAPSDDTVQQGKPDSLRCLAILRSLIALEDLEGVLALRFILPVQRQAGADSAEAASMPPGLLPQHKSNIVMFLERVYGIPDQAMFFRMLEDGFLPDMRAATTLENASASDGDMALALNRYLCNNVLPLLSKYAHYFSGADNQSQLIDACLHTAYRLSKCRSLTKNQNEVVSEFLVALTSQLRPQMINRLLRKLTIDVPMLTENTLVALQVLTHHYEKFGAYYSSSGMPGQGIASDEQRRLTALLFSGLFDALANKPYDPELFSKALLCLSAIGCALPPDYTPSAREESWFQLTPEGEAGYNPQPADTTGITIPPTLKDVAVKFAEHYHDTWAVRQDRDRYLEPVVESLKALVAWGWKLELDETRSTFVGGASATTRQSTSGGADAGQGGAGAGAAGYAPKPTDLSSFSLNRDLQVLADKLAENAHEIWAKRKKEELEAIGGGIHPMLVPYDILTEREKGKDCERARELIRFLYSQGYRLISKEQQNAQAKLGKESEDSGLGGNVALLEKHFASSLLEKLLDYVDKASINMQKMQPSSIFTRRNSYAQATEDVKFFGKVVLPLIERYFNAHKAYFLAIGLVGAASIKEKEMAATLFCRLAAMLRRKLTAFGPDIAISVRCLQVLVQAIDARSVIRNSPDVVRTSLVPFFAEAADDLSLLVKLLQEGSFSHVKGTISRGAVSVDYIHMVLLPVQLSLFSHLTRCGYGADVLVDDIQLACFKILNALYILGTKSTTFPQRDTIKDELDRHRPRLGECLAAFAGTFPVAFLEPDTFFVNRHSILFGKTTYEDHSREASEVLNALCANLPRLEDLNATLEELAMAGGQSPEAQHIIEVSVSMLCSYLAAWWSKGPDNVRTPSDPQQPQNPSAVTAVQAEMMNGVLRNVLSLIEANIGNADAAWMKRIAGYAQPIVSQSTPEMLRDNLLPVALKLRDRAVALGKAEEQYNQDKRYGNDVSETELALVEQLQLLVRDLFAFYPMLLKYIDLHRSAWILQPRAEVEELYNAVADVFNFWTQSNHIKREETNFVAQNEIDIMSLIMPVQAKGLASAMAGGGETGGGAAGGGQDGDNKAAAASRPATKRERRRKAEQQTSIVVACLKRLLPVAMNMLSGRQQELVQVAKVKFLQKESEQEIFDFIKTMLAKEDEPTEDNQKWQKILYKKIGGSQTEDLSPALAMATRDARFAWGATRVCSVAKVVYGMHVVDHPQFFAKNVWKKVISVQRRRAVMACFRMVPLYVLPRHRAINLFLTCYSQMWLETEVVETNKLIEYLTEDKTAGEDASATSEAAAAENAVACPAPAAAMPAESGGEGGPGPAPAEPAPEEAEEKPDSLKQLVAAFSRIATAERAEPLPPDDLFMKMAVIMSKSCSVGEEDEAGGEEGGEEAAEPDAEEAAKQLEEDELAKQQLISEQARLAERGVAEMVIQYIAASRGEMGEMVMTAINLGISLLTGGNVDVQSRMLQHLKDTKNVDFFQSIATLLEHCSVLDLDAFERCNKAQALGMSTESNPELQNLHDQDSTCQLFRFLQLLCEGHNLDNQNYLRAQTGSNTSVNLIISTVDYLLRLQESIMDFYWFYSNKETIEESGRDCFTKAITVASQVFNTLTEFIQGPCVGNQLALAHSRLWDAVGGFMYIFAHMQDKLSKDPDQIELLKEFMGLQKDMMILLLSMLEGNVVNGPIGKQMVDTLAESTANVEMILKFFDIFLKMKDLTSSEAFMAIDNDGNGVVSGKEFRAALENQKVYTTEEIDYVMRCVDTNQDGKIDFIEFVDRFHNPAKEIGYNLAVLLTNLMEHIPNDARLGRLLEKAKSVLDYFEKYLGRIEIMGSANRIERVYFEISQNNIDQWEKPQIRESKRSFLHSAVNEGGDKEKLEVFVNFCEDTIFEMQHAASLSCEDQATSGGQAGAGAGGDGAADGEGAQQEDMSPAMMVVNVFKTLYDIVWFFISLVMSVFSILTWSNFKYAVTTLSNMSLTDMLLATARLQVRLMLWLLHVVVLVLKTFGLFILNMMRGPPNKDADEALLLQQQQAAELERQQQQQGFQLTRVKQTTMALPKSNDEMLMEEEEEELAVFGVKMTKKGDGFVVTPDQADLHDQQPGAATTTAPASTTTTAESPEPQPPPNGLAKALPQPRIFKDAPDPSVFTSDEVKVDKGADKKGTNYSKLVASMLARNFYRFKFIALMLTFMINVILLFSKVNQQVIEPSADDSAADDGVVGGGDDDGTSETVAETVVNLAGEIVKEIVNATEAVIDAVGEAAEAASGEGGDEDEPEVFEWVTISADYSYLEPTLRILAFLHTCCAFALLVGYYFLKVPLVLFKREKDVSRRLEFDGLWIAEQPADDDLRGHWDKLVLSTPSFPKIYWDKFVKKKVVAKYSEQFDRAQIIELLGMDRPQSSTSSRLPAMLQNIDWQYLVWKWGAIFTDQPFLYIFFYFLLSVLGNFKYFAFACHLVDIAVSIKTLQTILLSVMQNGRQLMLTAMLLSVVVYFYTVIAFNFFRQFYVLGEDGEEADAKCHDMLTCYAFHLYMGVRSGGGVGDVIESPDGSSVMVYRMIFDMSFFFFVIVILLAIMQGLIIDAFGELRDQLEQVREDLESKCFICGIGKDYFDSVPHGFEQHTQKEHNFANYMFFLMHLINKDETEYTGQETYVWQLYQQRSWDFFPAGVCFRQQYEVELGLGSGQSGGSNEKDD